MTNDDAHHDPVAEELAELCDEVETSGSVVITVKDLLERLGEPDPTAEARLRAIMLLANKGLTESPPLAGVGVRPRSTVTLRLTERLDWRWHWT